MSSKWLPNNLADICTPAKVYIVISLLGLFLDRMSPRPVQTQINPFNVLWGIIFFSKISAWILYGSYEYV